MKIIPYNSDTAEKLPEDWSNPHTLEDLVKAFGTTSVYHITVQHPLNPSVVLRFQIDTTDS